MDSISITQYSMLATSDAHFYVVCSLYLHMMRVAKALNKAEKVGMEHAGADASHSAVN
jgi:hypothetical protein